MDSNGRRFDSYRDEMSPFPDRMSPFLHDVSPFHREVSPSPDDVSPFRREVSPFHTAISQDSRDVSPLGHHLGLLGPSVCPPAKPVDQSYVGCHSEMWGNDADAAKPRQAIVAVVLFRLSRCDRGRVFKSPALVPSHHWGRSKTPDLRHPAPSRVVREFGLGHPASHWSCHPAAHSLLDFRSNQPLDFE